MGKVYVKKVGNHSLLHSQPVSAMVAMWAHAAVRGVEEPGAGSHLTTLAPALYTALHSHLRCTRIYTVYTVSHLHYCTTLAAALHSHPQCTCIYTALVSCHAQRDRAMHSMIICHARHDRLPCIS